MLKLRLSLKKSEKVYSVMMYHTNYKHQAIELWVIDNENIRYGPNVIS